MQYKYKVIFCISKIKTQEKNYENKKKVKKIKLENWVKIGQK